jgi:hypothetical protein
MKENKMFYNQDMIVKANNLKTFIKTNAKKETFSDLVMFYIEKNKLIDTEVYREAGIDRRLFSKIRRRDYKPKKTNVIALALALRLDEKESKNLIKRAGYILTRGSRFDLVILYCIHRKIYRLIDVNALLVNEGLQPINVLWQDQ